MYKRIIGLMHAYKPTDFHSPVLIQYVLHGLCFNKSLYAEVMKKDMSGELKQLISNILGQSCNFPYWIFYKSECKVLEMISHHGVVIGATTLEPIPFCCAVY